MLKLLMIYWQNMRDDRQSTPMGKYVSCEASESEDYGSLIDRGDGNGRAYPPHRNLPAVQQRPRTPRHHAHRTSRFVSIKVWELIFFLYYYWIKIFKFILCTVLTGTPGSSADSPNRTKKMTNVTTYSTLHHKRSRKSRHDSRRFSVGGISVHHSDAECDIVWWFKSSFIYFFFIFIKLSFLTSFIKAI